MDSNDNMLPPALHHYERHLRLTPMHCHVGKNKSLDEHPRGGRKTPGVRFRPFKVFLRGELGHHLQKDRTNQPRGSNRASCEPSPHNGSNLIAKTFMNSNAESALFRGHTEIFNDFEPSGTSSTIFQINC